MFSPEVAVRQLSKNKHMNIMKLRPLFYLISGFLLAASIFSIVVWRFQLSEDFVGGTNYQIKLPNNPDKTIVQKVFQDNKIKLTSVTVSGSTYTLKFPPISQDQKVKLEDDFKKIDKNYETLKFSTQGPSLGRELINKTVVAIVLSAITLLLFIASRFSDITFGTGAVLAMIHDSIILIGAFSLLGHFLGAQLDSLFVTALLTTLSASVHDTVVTFDRIRELKRQKFQLDWVSLANQAVTETIVRSFNNSMTVIIMLFSLVLLGGETTRWFAAALLIGVVCGTYSSTGVAIPIVLFLKKLQSNRKNKKK